MPVLSAKEAAKRGKSPPRNAATRKANANARLKALNKQRKRNSKTIRNSGKVSASASAKERFAAAVAKNEGM
jgi:hypothetical protein